MHTEVQNTGIIGKHAYRDPRTRIQLGSSIPLARELNIFTAPARNIWLNDMFSVVHVKTEKLAGFHVYKTFPNPFNPTTAIRFQIPIVENVTRKNRNVLSQEVAILANRIVEAGEHQVRFIARGLPGEVYFYP
jgi:hypothetical protein